MKKDKTNLTSNIRRSHWTVVSQRGAPQHPSDWHKTSKNTSDQKFHGQETKKNPFRPENISDVHNLFPHGPPFQVGLEQDFHKESIVQKSIVSALPSPAGRARPGFHKTQLHLEVFHPLLSIQRWRRTPNVCQRLCGKFSITRTCRWVHNQPQGWQISVSRQTSKFQLQNKI